MISCKEGNKFACARNLERHTNWLDCEHMWSYVIRGDTIRHSVLHFV
jgi:hypothetical protein